VEVFNFEEEEEVEEANVDGFSAERSGCFLRVDEGSDSEGEGWNSCEDE
jgi:hypothetical protein